MANENGWGDGSSNNNIGWGKGADNAIGWGAIHADSWAGLTDIVGTPAVDADAQAFITAATITDPTQQSAINQLVVDLKGYNIWSKMKALYPFVGGTAAQHKWNLKDPRDLDAAFRLVFSGGWTHSSTGALPNGTNAYADTFLNTNTQLNVNSHAFGIYSRTNNTSGTQVYGATDLNSFLTNNLSSGNFVSGSSATNLITYTANPSTSLIIASRTSNIIFKGYRAGVFLNQNTNTITSLPSLTFYLGARNGGTGTAQFYNNHQIAFAFLSEGLSDTESGNLYTAVQAFQVTLGRSIGTQTVSDADAQAFVTNAGIVDQVEANAVNNLVIGLKADGLWTKMKALYPFVGGTSTTNKFNLKNPLDTDAAFRLVFNGGWTHSANGALPNGTNAYANTYLAPSAQQSLTSGHFSLYSRTLGASSTVYGCNGVRDQITALGSQLSLRRGIDSLRYAAMWDEGTGGIAGGGTETDARGFYLGSRTANNSLKFYKNNTTIASNTATQAATSLSTYSYFLGAINQFNVALLDSYDNKQLAFASIGDGLSDAEATNFYNRVQTFNTALARQV